MWESIRKNIFDKFLSGAAALSAKHLQNTLVGLIDKKIQFLPSDEALRFLFQLDEMLYTWEGQKAIEYGNGVHTKHRHIRYHDFFAKRIGQDDRVLDVGCGDGAVAYDIAEKTGARVVGIDMSVDKIDKAVKLHPHSRVEYYVLDVVTSMPKGEFDVVILSNVLEHIENRTELLRAVQGSDRNARLLIRVPLFERDWRVPLKKELGIDWRLDPDHEVEYTLEGFAEEMALAKLNIVLQEVRWGEIWAEAISDSVHR